MRLFQYYIFRIIINIKINELLMMFVMKRELINSMKEKGFSEKIIDAFQYVKREVFVPDEFVSSAYENRDLPLGMTSSLTQPTVIAFMLELARLKEGMSVLEIGSGSGYLLSLARHIVKSGRVVGIEINRGLVEYSREKLIDEDVKVIFGDGKNGIPGDMFDRIIVSTGFCKEPYHLLDQLNVGGILVVPVRNSICQIIRNGNEIREREFEGFIFYKVL